MTPQDLEAAYDQPRWAPNMQQVLARIGAMSDAARAAIGAPARLSYGPAGNEGLDLYKTDRARAPVAIFVHGGGWRRESARDNGFPAEMLYAAGVHFIALDFSTVVEAKGDLGVLVEQVRRAVVWVHQNCSSFGGDAGRLYLVGHSSGAYLAAMALSTRWTDYGLGADPLKGGILISGIYDLGPLRHTSRRQYVLIDDRIERQLSPIHRVADLTSPLLMAVGSRESPEFLRQTRDYARAVAGSGTPTKVIIGDNYNHFEILETLGNPYGLVGRHVLNFISAGRL